MNQEEATQALRQNGIKVEGQTITIPPSHSGIRLWKYIDYLCHNHEFHWVKKNGDS